MEQAITNLKVAIDQRRQGSCSEAKQALLLLLEAVSKRVWLDVELSEIALR